MPSPSVAAAGFSGGTAGASAALAPPDWTALGLVLAIVGAFLVGNAVLFRNPRTMIAERFGVAVPHLRRIRELVFHRVQMSLGFAFLVAGFAAQLYGRARPAAPESAGSLVTWIGIVVVAAVALELAGWWWSRRSLRRHVRAFLRAEPIDLEADPALARELGELYAIEPQHDDTVQAYVARLRRTIGTLPPPRSAQRASETGRRVALVPPEESETAFEET
jgi:hypothetical protein